MSKKITKTMVDKAEANLHGDVWLWDAEVEGFGVRIKPTGRKTYVVRYRAANGTQRKMTMYRNVRPLLMDTSGDRDTALMDAERHLKARAIVQKGDIYAITCGEPMGAPGGTNMLKICRVE